MGLGRCREPDTIQRREVGSLDLQIMRKLSMNEQKTLRNLKVGDTVFVVQQERRGQEPVTSREVIARVGRKYAYFARYCGEVPFCRETGKSHHPGECNARANGLGFDVYQREEDYRREQHETSEHKRLADRITDRWHQLVKFAPEVVAKIHAVLDEAEN